MARHLRIFTIGFLAMIAASSTGASDQVVLTSFSPSGDDLGWHVVNDNVMGGRSEGGFSVEQGALLFAGRTNTNGGGFSSIRTQPLQLNLTDFVGVSLRVRGDGRRYTWRLTTDATYRGYSVAYWADFATQDGAWQTVRIPFTDFVPRVRGSQLSGPQLNAARITGMGLMIYDKLDGPFALSLDSVHAYAAPGPFSLADYRYEKRVLVLGAPTANDASLCAQLQHVADSSREFLARDMVVVVVLESDSSHTQARELTQEEAAMVRTVTQLDDGAFSMRLVGKDGGIKAKIDRVVAMEDIYALIDTMPMRRAEARERDASLAVESDPDYVLPMPWRDMACGN